MNYTIPRNKWELQRLLKTALGPLDYTIPRNKWELQLIWLVIAQVLDYTIPRNKWELQLARVKPSHFSIIPYQEINGNYNRN